ncbi:MAG: hypothetical protein OHK0011_05250 [Turneriella sp.]
MIGTQELCFCQRLQAFIAAAGAGFPFFDALFRMDAKVEFGLLHRRHLKSSAQLRKEQEETQAMEDSPAHTGHKADLRQ